MKLFQKKPAALTCEDVLDAFREDPVRWFRSGNDETFRRVDDWGFGHTEQHRIVYFPPVYAKPYGFQIGTIRDVEIKIWMATAYFTHFAVEKSAIIAGTEIDVRGKGIASSMMRAYLRKLQDFYRVRYAVFDTTKTLGEGDYETFLTDRLGALPYEGPTSFRLDLERPLP
ncbi:hypothetical protein QA646_27090 (plasmid) [Rhizobium sp. CB3090]|uniref:hypothetical protein n=1 Tax=Rhizobium sp. CB3090 TaxID=3039156 RepID=UPI0024B24E8F|nr:hypothetical protein [Rhizobium sp. CB3090]WFU13026.1 hypothetical protein QA646_27090 [Rhizobium sp. CB3090]